MAVPKYVTGVAESGEVIPPQPDLQSLPVTPFSGLPPMMPSSAQAPSMAQPQAQPSKFAELMKAILPAVTGVMAARQGGPGAAAALLKSYSDELSTKRKEADARHRLELLDARDEFDRNDRAMKYQTEQRQKLATFENSIASQLAKTNDPDDYAELVRYADEAGAAAHGAPIGYFYARYALTPSAKETRLAKKALEDMSPWEKAGVADGRIDTAKTLIGGKSPFKGLTIRAVQDKAGLTGLVTTTGEPLQPLPTQKSEPENESAFITRAIQAKSKALGRALTEAETNAEAIKARQQWSESGRASGDASLGDDISNIVDGIVKGFQPPTLSGLYRNTAAVRAELQRRGYNLTQATQDWEATKRYLNTLNGPQQVRLRQAVNFTKESLPIIEDLSEQWKSGRFAILNRVNLVAAKNGAFGKDAESIARRLEAQIADLVSELGTVYKGGNSSTDESLRLAAENLGSDWSEKALRDGINQIRMNLTIRENSIRTSGVIAGTMGNPYQPQSPPAHGVTRMKAPDGTIKDIPDADVEHYKRLGATVVK